MSEKRDMNLESETTSENLRKAGNNSWSWKCRSIITIWTR
jgi:hypothetical protein